MKTPITISLLLASIVCFSQVTCEKIISLEPNLSFQHYEHYKRLTLDSPDSRIEYLNDFNFEWGYKVKLLVKETTLREALSDGTQYQYEFIKLLSKIKVPDSIQFNLTIDPQRYYNELEGEEASMNETLKQLSDSAYLYFDKVEIKVPEHLREIFETIANGKKSRRGRFDFLDANCIRVVRFN